jgi:hypothetical protein
MKQQTLSGFEKYGKTARRAQFLTDMDRIIPWPEMTAAVERVYPKISENGGRPPIPLERILRIHFLQLWFNLCGLGTSLTSAIVGANALTRRSKLRNRTKSRVRAKVEHTIGVIKRVFGFQKVRYRGLAKSRQRLEVTRRSPICI